MTDSPTSAASAAEQGRSHAGLWLALAVVAVMLLADWFYGSFTRPLIQQLLFGQATIKVTSEPAGAQVLLDTLELGSTPLADGKALPGKYLLRIEHPHFEPVRESIALARGEEISRHVELLRSRGSLELVSNPRGASIRLNGELQDAQTPVTLTDIAAGIYEVELRLPGRKTVRETIDVAREQQAQLAVDLNLVPTGVLSIDVTPADASIELVGAEVLYSPDMSLPLGDYLVRASSPGFAAQEQQVSLRRGPNRLRFELEQFFGELRVTVSPPSARVTVRSGGTSQRYTEPLSVPVGKVRISASQLGYRSRSKSIELGTEGADVALKLPRFDVTPGRVFRDALKAGGRAPEIVVVAAGDFVMGDRSGVGAADERPAHRVQLRAPFGIGVSEVTQAEWDLQFGGTGGDQPQLPKTNVSREQISKYLRWLSAQTGNRYRLPTEAEWEFAARAGGDALFGVTDTLTELCKYANIADQTLNTTYRDWQAVDCDDAHVRMAPVRSFAPNAFGLYDTIGNASEWVADCWHGNYAGAPASGRAWGDRCSTWVVRGGAWDSGADGVRVSYRAPGAREKGDQGFRIARDL